MATGSDITDHAAGKPIILYRFGYMSKLTYAFYLKGISVSTSFSGDQFKQIKTVVGDAPRFGANELGPVGSSHRGAERREQELV